MLLLFFGGILLVDGVLAPFNFMVFKYFDPDYYAYRRLCLIYPAQIVHDKPLYKLYRHDQRLSKQAQKPLEREAKTQYAKAKRYNTLAKKQNKRIAEANYDYIMLRDLLTLGISAGFASESGKSEVGGSEIRGSEISKSESSRAGETAFLALGQGLRKFADPQDYEDYQAYENHKNACDDRTPCQAQKQLQHLLHSITLRLTSESELESIAKQWQTNKPTIIKRISQEKREACKREYFVYQQDSCLERLQKHSAQELAESSAYTHLPKSMPSRF